MIRTIRLYMQRQQRTWWDNAFVGLQMSALGVGWWVESFDTGMFLLAVAFLLYCLTSLVVVVARNPRQQGERG